jgi:LemA protein
MNQMLMIVVLVALLGFGVLFTSIYNALVNLRHQIERAWANIDVILKQRFDELPQLMRVIEQYAGYEAGILRELADARSRYGSAQSVDDKIRAATDCTMAFRGLAALGEAYPELRANRNFLQLQARVSELENVIADRRESYNECVANFNARIEQFPDVFAARFLGYEEQNLYRVAETEKQQPDLTMSLPVFDKPR